MCACANKGKNVSHTNPLKERVMLSACIHLGDCIYSGGVFATCVEPLSLREGLAVFTWLHHATTLFWLFIGFWSFG